MFDQVIIKEPGISGWMPWHQDFSRWPFERANQVSCWLALDHVTKESGAMQYAPGSHRLGEYAAVESVLCPRDPTDPRPEIPADPVAAGYDVVVMELAPGECVLHHAFTWHATEPNRSNRPRRGLITRFMPRGTRLRTQPHGPRPDTPGSAHDPRWSLERDDVYPVVWPK
jgi:ectoine hydroxylase-related dioxygenase (phytanoyl-CoA dioxygenase family)